MAVDGFDQRLQELLPRIRARREEIEEGRRLPKDLAADLANTGVFRLGVPAALGGDDGTLMDMMRAFETIAGADGSTGWCSMIGSGGASMAGMLPEAGVKEVFADPSIPTASVVPPMQGTAVPTDGGFTINGKWRFASGITHVDWVMGGCVILYDGAPRMTEMGIPEVTWAFMPVTEIEIHDTWYVNGLRGTGSNDISATNIFVPAHRTFHLFDPTNHRSDPMVRIPGVSGFTVQVASVAIGIARAALDDLVELAGGKMPTMSMSSLASKPATQIEVAQLEGQLGGVRALLYEAAEEIWTTTVAGDEVSKRTNALARLACVEAARVAAAVAHRVSTIAGGSSLYSSSPIQRHARDADAITHHFSVAPPVMEDAGRVLLGLDPLSPIF
ncbi:MAG: acyl-CoA dehydrogenase family protein [Actinomycetota bacterium]